MGDLEEQVEIANPGESHCAVVLLLDTSSSMSNRGKISSLNDGLRRFHDEVTNDELARKRVDLSVVQFGGSVRVSHEFASIEEFDPPELSANGRTPMGEAILRGIDLLEERKQNYKSRGVDYNRPFLFLFTDGQPTDMEPGDNTWNEVTNALEDGVKGNHFVPFLVGTGSNSVDRLQRLTVEGWPALQLKEGKFDEMFEWLSNSVQEASKSVEGEQKSMKPSEEAFTFEPAKAS